MDASFPSPWDKADIHLWRPWGLPGIASLLAEELLEADCSHQIPRCHQTKPLQDLERLSSVQVAPPGPIREQAQGSEPQGLEGNFIFPASLLAERWQLLLFSVILMKLLSSSHQRKTNLYLPRSCSVNFKWVDGLLIVSLSISLFKEITKTEIQSPGFITWLGQYALTEIY